MSKGFPYQDQIAELFIVMVLLYVFPTRNIVNFLIMFTFFNCSILIKGTTFPICAESAINS